MLFYDIIIKINEQFFAERRTLMKITKIKISNYKSIKEPIEINFSDLLPTVLIGKNGSGKTNILEALETIASANVGYYGNANNRKFEYEVQIQLSKDDFTDLLSGTGFNKSIITIVVLNGGDGMRIDTLRSDVFVPLLKKQVEDIRSVSKRLSEELKLYETQIDKIAISEQNDSPIQCYKISNHLGHVTNYSALQWQIQHTIDETRKALNSIEKQFSGNNSEYIFANYVPFYYNSGLSFELLYQEPDLPEFEKSFITIDADKIKMEIEKINKATKESCEKIKQYINVLNERTKCLTDALVYDNYPLWRDSKYFQLLQTIKKEIGKKCAFLLSENSAVIFRDKNTEWMLLQKDNTRTILETYFKKVYSGEDKAELLNQMTNQKDFSLSNKAIEEFEAYLNNNLPAFENGMYEKISVEKQGDKSVSIRLHERGGDIVDLNCTSSGRRWYFTYYFTKNALEPGDLFIIDEPASTLHPSAQKEVLKELLDIEKKESKLFIQHIAHI